MSKSTETSPEKTAHRERSKGLRIVRYVIPSLIALLAIVIIVGAWTKELTRDYQIATTEITGLVSCFLLTIWFACFGNFTKRIWYVVAFAPWAVLGVACLLLKIEYTGDMLPARIVWRWGATEDSRLAVPDSTGPIDLTKTTASDYPRFLGPDGIPIVNDVSLATDWNVLAPELVWRQPIGAGWSAFAIVGDYAVTQEQRGDREMVVCYEVKTGHVVWTHSDPGRFTSALGGDGPRATPTLSDGKVYTPGAGGLLNCLDGATGERFWSHDTLSENNAENIGWGKSGSPLVVEELVIVSVGGPAGRSLIAYDKHDGTEVWNAGNDPSSYATPVLATIGGVRQVLSINQHRIAAHRLEDGKELWSHPWLGDSNSNATASQPVLLPGDRVFLSKGYGIGCALLQIEADAAGLFSAKQLWASARLMNTKLTNVVVKGPYIFGLSGGILECIDSQTGERRWKRGRYGHGQNILVDNVILITTERGEIALVAANPDEFQELSRFQAIEGKTWNNPALTGRYLLVRNHQEAACYKLPLVE